MMPEKMQQATKVGDQFLVRVPVEVGYEIRELAKQGNMSLSNFIAKTLKDALEGNHHNERKI